MSTHRISRVRRDTAERLLAGQPAGPLPLARVLGAAAAPASVRELAGEPAAVAHFRATRTGSAATHRRAEFRPALVKTAVASLFTVKVLTGVAVAAAATGGVALAAATDTLPGPLHGAAHGAVHAPAVPGSASAAQVAAPPRTSATHDAEAAPAKPSVAASPATPSPSLTGLCTAYQAGVASNPGKALDNRAFAALITASGGKDKVAGYCTAQLAAAHPAGGSSSHPNNRPSTPASSRHPTGPPSTIPAGPPAESPGPAPR